jgi:hypothetical protein
VAKVIHLTVQTKADLAGIQAVQKAIQGLGQATSKISTVGGKGAANPFAAAGAAALKAERDVLRYASALASVQKAQGNAAGAAQTWRNALAQLTPNTIEAHRATAQLTMAQNALDKSARQAGGGMAVLPRTIAGLSHEAAAAAAGMLTLGTAFGVASATVRSFADAFQFKANLDATTLAINAQLKGVRDSGAVWDQASTFAAKFKLTQEETTNAISASIGVMRASKAPVEDILGVLARMQVLSPEQSLQEAAIALKALASGDTTSLVTRFEVGRDVANQMKQEIQGGADAVAVMSKFLGDTGIGMDVLATKTTGAMGKMKELAQAQEQLKLAQAEFAAGPGMVVLEGQIRTVAGATRTLSGDFEAMRGSVVTSINEGVAAMSQWNPVAAAVAQAIGTVTGATAVQAAQQQQATAATQLQTGATVQLGGAMDEVRSAIGAAQVATQQAAAASLTDAAAKEEEAAKLALSAAEANAAASAFMLLHPNISASGVASLQAAGQITPLLSQLIQAKIRADAAANALARFNAIQGVKATRLIAGEDQSGVASEKRALAESARLERQRQSAAKSAAEADRIQAVGNSAQKIALAQKEYDAQVKLYGAGSTQAYNYETKLLKAKEDGVSKRGGAASAGASKAETQAAAAATKLEGIETKTGDKLAQIVTDTQAKLIEIDRKAAAERAKIATDLANKIATSAADRRATNEADDLDLIGVADEKAAQKLNDREAAQAKAREREVAAAKEAQDAIANGEAESASKVYDIREKQIGDQQALDEKYAERQRELAGNEENLAALKTQYDEATRANEEAAQRRIDIAKAEAEAKKGEVQAEKDAVIAAAEEQANQVVSAAQRSAAGVTKATGAASAQAQSDLRKIGDAVNAIPTSKTVTITVKQDGSVGTSSSGGGGGGNKAAGGGNFMTSGPTTLRVGDNPGGRELVTVTPLSGKGTSRASGNLIALAGGGTVDAGGGYTTPIAGPTPKKKKKGKGKAGAGPPSLADQKKILDEYRNVVQMLSDMAKLKEQIADLAGVPAFDIPMVQALVNRAQEFTAYVKAHLVPITKKEVEGLDFYFKAAQGATSVISDMASLKKDIAELKDVPAFDQSTVLALIDRAQQFTVALQNKLIPLTEFEAEQFSRYASAVGDSVSILKDMADLKKDLAEPAPPLDTRYINQLVADAAVVTVIMRQHLIGTTEEQADAIGQYASAVGDTIGILNDTLDLKKNLAEGSTTPISSEMIARLADEAARVTSIVSARLVPATEAEAEGLSRYADLVGSSVSVLKDVSELTGKMFTDYTSPTDAQLLLLTTDAQRVTDAFFRAGQTMGKEGAEAGKVYAEGVGAAFSAVKEGLLVMDALKSGDFKLPGDALRQFEASSMDILDVTSKLGARASQIPAGDMAALQTATAAIAGQAEALIRLAAVPFGDLGGAASGLAQSGGAMGGMGSNTTTIYNTFNLPPGSNQQTAQEVIRLLNQQTGAHR